MNVKQDLELQQQSDHSSDQLLRHPQGQRRPRGFAAAAAAAAAADGGGGASSGGGGGGGTKGKREREKEKERTKLRERHRRAITSRMLAGLRQYGNFPLPARADMNDVLAALAREAGWTVDADGTTYRPSSAPSLPPPPSQLYPVRSVESPLSVTSLKNCSIKASLDCLPSPVFRIDESLSPASIDSVVAAERDMKGGDKYMTSSPITSPDCVDADQLMRDVRAGEHGNGLTRTPYVPVFVMLPTGIINNFCQLVDPEGIRQELKHLKSLHIDGVSVDCWWGISEGWNPQKYVWSGYRELFNIIREVKLKVQVYFDFMRSFRAEFDDLFSERLISAVEIGLGASGELKYPSFPERLGWRYPGIGEFQCYDKYMQQNLRKAAKLRGHSFWATGPNNAGQYNSRPHDTGFFCERGDYDSYYGRFFLHWYSQTLIDHADHVLSLANLAFEETRIIVKIPAVYWWYRTASHAAELTAGFYNPTNQDGYSRIFNMLKNHSATLKFVFSEHPSSAPESDEAFADLEGLIWQFLNSAWDHGLTVAGQNSLPCYDRESYARILETAKPRNDPDHRHLSFFVFQQPPPATMQRQLCLSELDLFIKCMHGEVTGDVQN
ncbi:Beta-amylase 8 [Acorus gramineus]|uniref:Beta-amylase n=1 Tax=Acorus gramineus TaxID=55184 RepID=A0AAV9ACY8_ACOGR|nr:Beta-amylase 8 [Acorus gramineus]